MKSARLALEDGSVFWGHAFGDLSPRTIDGEVCFNTSLTGYQEVLTDPSYAGQIVTMTNPLIGNYGVNDEDLESRGVFVRGFVVREASSVTSNYRSQKRLQDWLADANVLGIEGLDTRALTRKLRLEGALRGVLSNEPTEVKSDADLVAMARASRGLVGVDLASTVSDREAGPWERDLGAWRQAAAVTGESPKRVIALDCGCKYNILRNLVESGCRVTAMPIDTPAAAILEQQPEGIFISNGPGDPAAVAGAIQTLKGLIGQAPIFGICLGHQLLSLAMGATTFKLKFGHRGGNQPVQNLHTQKVEITSQNHGFAVDQASLQAVGGEPTHVNLNDGTLEGYRHAGEPIFAVQYHPEASPGPHDAGYLFDCFVQMMRTGKSPTGEDMDAAQRRRFGQPVESAA